jgi:threonylcarbamoyladenosine tRNA methylthiotransferase MtaB
LARGKSRSETVASTLDAARKIISESQPSEIVLTGVNTGDFGRYNGESFFDLVKGLDELAGVSRFRISSIEPNLLSDEIISFCANSKKFVPHFHIPLQSGSNKILRLMRRRYQRELYTQRVDTILQTMPDACIGVDVIVGFPGETNEDFLETYQYLNELPISYLHVFTYSERDNTHAVSMPGVVDQKARAERSHMLRILSEKKKRAFYLQHVGRNYPVLWEGEKTEGEMFGFTSNYIKVRTPWNPELINQIRVAEITAIEEDGIGSVKLLEHSIDQIMAKA